MSDTIAHLRQPQSESLTIEQHGAVFVMSDDNGPVAEGASARALASWAFRYGGAYRVVHNYDLGMDPP